MCGRLGLNSWLLALALPGLPWPQLPPALGEGTSKWEISFSVSPHPRLPCLSNKQTLKFNFKNVCAYEDIGDGSKAKCSRHPRVSILWYERREVLNEDFFALQLSEDGTYCQTGSQAGIPQEQLSCPPQNIPGGRRVRCCGGRKGHS